MKDCSSISNWRKKWLLDAEKTIYHNIFLITLWHFIEQKIPWTWKLCLIKHKQKEFGKLIVTRGRLFTPSKNSSRIWDYISMDTCIKVVPINKAQQTIRDVVGNDSWMEVIWIISDIPFKFNFLQFRLTKDQLLKLVSNMVKLKKEIRNIQKEDEQKVFKQ